MHRSLLSLTSLTYLLLPTAVFADDLLNRLEAATEQVSKNQAEFYLSKAPELKDKLPAWEWDEEMRSASSCVLNGIEQTKGKTVAEAYVSSLETMANTTVESMADLSSGTALPAELQGGDQTLTNLMQSCGTLELSAVRLKESGFWDAMMEPSVRNKLMAE